MTDIEGDNDLSFMANFEDRLWTLLRNDGLSDDEIWALIGEALEYNLGELSSFGKREYAGLALAEIQFLYNKLEDSHYMQHLVNWIADGWLIAALGMQAGLENYDKKLLSERARIAGSAKKRRFSLINVVVKDVMSGAPPDNRTITYFREKVGEFYVVRTKTAEVEVRAKEDESGRIGYELYDLNKNYKPDEPIPVTPETSIRAAISKLFGRAS